MKRTAALALAALLVAGLTGAGTKRARERAGIPVLPARVPLGGLEPLAVDLLWIRATTLEREHRLTAAAAEYRLVTEIEPRIAEAWTFPAWILANTETGIGRPEQEWRWVEQGIRLLRRGLVVNPDDPGLLFWLGLIYWNRLSRDDRIYATAMKHLGRRPEEAAIEVLDRLDARRPKLAERLLADCWRLLGDHRMAAGDKKGAIAAWEASLPFWKRIAARPGGKGAMVRYAEVEKKIRAAR